jgi:protein-tyrosine phosphatase
LKLGFSATTFGLHFRTALVFGAALFRKWSFPTMPEVVELREVTDRRDAIHRAVQRLSSGDLVVLPSEAGYVLAGAALVEGSGSRLSQAGGTLTLLLRAAEEATDFLPYLSPVGVRFAKRCWPGPLVLLAPANATNGFVAALPESTQSLLVRDGQMSVRVSSHPVLSEIAKLSRGPLLVRDIETPTQTTDFSSLLWGQAALVVKVNSAAESSSKPPAESLTTIVQIDSRGGWTAERIGATPENRLQVAACELILFCCTGNTCRSPMAESLCRHLLCERLKCSPSELTKRGYLIASAGLAAHYGSPASRESVEMMRRRGLDLKAHSSQPLTDRLIEHADRCYTLTNGHRAAILDNHPELSGRVQVLARDGSDISDPIGGGIDDYAACAASIEQHLKKVIDEIA